MSFLDRLKAVFEEPELPSGFPPTAAPAPGMPLDNERLEFDPALMHFTRGFKTTDPPMLSDGEAMQLQAVHGWVLQHILATIAASDFANHLVLRGSVTMPLFTDRARPPRDIDLVVVPSTMSIERDGQRLLASIAQAVVTTPLDGVDWLGSPLRSGIWTYDRVPGQRIVFRWKYGSLPWSASQVDVTFNEKLHEPPVDVEGLAMKAVGPTSALASKLLWLSADMHPQAKDLYDAMLLVEALRPLTVDQKALIDRVIKDDLEAAWEYLGGPELEWAGMAGVDEKVREQTAQSWWSTVLAGV